MSEHTPWRWERKGCQVKDRNGHEVAEISVSRIGEPELESRGQLFAAAPETARLLAELVAAAEPISAVAERIPDGINDYTVFLRFPLHDRGLDTEVTAGTLRRLAAAVAATKGE